MAKKGKARLTVIVMIFSMLCSSVVPIQAKKEIRVKKISVTAPKKQPLKMTVGQKYKLKVKITPKKATNKKLKYTTSSKKIVTVNKNGLLQAKKAGTAKITIKTRDKSNRKATVKVKVSKKKTNTVSVPTEAPASTPTQTILPVATPAQSPSVSPESTPTPIPDGDFVLASTSGVSQVYLNPDADEYKGLNMVAECFSKDVNMVSGAQPDIVTDVKKLKGNVIIFGSIGNNPMIDRLISEGKINVDNVKNKWEVYQYDVIENPVQGVEKALVITGSDKRGAIYGLFNLSEMMGVSPWVYWADVTPEHKDTISFNYSELKMTSKEPSVKYRGIFLNDEEPALGSWVKNHFLKDTGSKFNEYFYEKVFQLLLRLKANYMWPAMWNSAFGAGGVEFPEKSAELADQYGIVMGTSHHEPMMLAHEEWKSYKKDWSECHLFSCEVLVEIFNHS